jgi:hypothetical protein
VTLIFDTRALSQRSRSSRVPAKNPSSKALSLDSCTRSAKSPRESERRSSYCELSFSRQLLYPSSKARSHRALRFSLPDDEVAVARNRLTVPKSASLMNVLKDSHWPVEVAGDGRISGVGGMGIESVKICMFGSGEMAVVSASIR